MILQRAIASCTLTVGRSLVGCYKGRLIHVVAANNSDDDEIIVITVYELDTSEWDPDCRKRINKMRYLQKRSTKIGTATITF